MGGRFWQCPACGAFLGKPDATKFQGIHCRNCSVVQDKELVLEGAFDFAVEDETLEQILADSDNLAFDPRVDRWRYKGAVVPLVANVTHPDAKRSPDRPHDLVTRFRDQDRLGNYANLYRPPNERIESFIRFLNIGVPLLAVALVALRLAPLLVSLLTVVFWLYSRAIFRVALYQFEDFYWSCLFMRTFRRNRDPGGPRAPSLLTWTPATAAGRGTVSPVVIALSGMLIGVVAPLVAPELPAGTFAVVIIVCALSIIGDILQLYSPPVVLVLAASGDAATELHARLAYSIRPLRTVALLDLQGRDFGLRHHSFRYNKADWRKPVLALIRRVAIIVLDLRSVTEYVAEEIAMLESRERHDQTVVVVTDAGGRGAAAEGLGGVPRVGIEEVADLVRSLIERQGFQYQVKGTTVRLARTRG